MGGIVFLKPSTICVQLSLFEDEMFQLPSIYVSVLYYSGWLYCVSIKLSTKCNNRPENYVPTVPCNPIYSLSFVSILSEY